MVCLCFFFIILIGVHVNVSQANVISPNTCWIHEQKLKWNKYNSGVKSSYCSASAYPSIYQTIRIYINLSSVDKQRRVEFWRSVAICHALQSTGYYRGAATITAALISTICNSNGGFNGAQAGLHASLRMLSWPDGPQWPTFLENPHCLIAKWSNDHASLLALSNNFYTCC